MTIKETINSLRKMRYEIESPELASLSEGLDGAEDFRDLCLELAEEAVERELQAEAVQARIAELQERKGRLIRTADTLRVIVLQCMEIKGESAIQSPALTLSVSKLKPDVEVTDESVIPSRFFQEQAPKLDKKALKEAVLKDGEVIEGVTLGAAKLSLTIRRK